MNIETKQRIKKYIPSYAVKTVSNIKYNILKAYHVHLDRRNDNDKLSDMVPLSDEKSAWCTDGIIICHAGGMIEEHPYTNCMEAFQNSVAHGKKILEADFQITSDGKVILLHDTGSVWGEIRDTVSHDGFMNHMILGKYTPLDIEKLVDFMHRNQEAYVVTDCKKGTLDGVIREILRTCDDESLLNRFIIQLYQYEDAARVREIYDFRYLIFTLYDSGLYIWNAERIVKHCVRNGIGVVTMPYGFVRDDKALNLFREYNVKVCVHTVNDIYMAEELRKRGVTGIYTDEII
jgi:glycerophosphoryl diester phosphodiesterase